MIDKNVLKLYGENTANSAKCHFKAADLRKRTIMFLIITIMLVSIIGITQLIQSALINQLLGVLSLLGSILLLVFELQDGANSHVKHKAIGEAYIQLHYDIFHAFQDDKCAQKHITSLKNRMNDLNKSDKPFVSFFARRMAKRAIEVKEEMNPWWKPDALPSDNDESMAQRK